MRWARMRGLGLVILLSGCGGEKPSFLPSLLSSQVARIHAGFQAEDKSAACAELVLAYPALGAWADTMRGARSVMAHRIVDELEFPVMSCRSSQWTAAAAGWDRVYPEIVATAAVKSDWGTLGKWAGALLACGLVGMLIRRRFS